MCGRDRVISVTWSCPWSVFIISARMFFTDIPPTWFDVTSEDGHSVPWSSWGPQNSRFFPGTGFSGEGSGLFGVGGSRVIWVYPVAYGNGTLFHLHMTDFNPSAVARSIDNVSSKPTTSSLRYRSDVQVTTYLPFVEMIRDHVCRGSLLNIVLDEEKMAIITKPPIESGWRMQIDIFEP
ncbi:hypothetical protein DEU56DRAFT_984030 [Suillus clintonianus]|uniref:uncharacterized protein n=1 Tax=Suillus clintonianus TaxID=1904413 RepID=UPI001B860530|nr:uncharacterized protein DEU56DRAFT_984030 [Suillus clintonianus]KAG2122584.1 hypothetical protein DEU56DRAFT_984030 [Suillus clintonianus]